MLLFGDLGEHVFDVANLHRLGADGVVDAHDDEQGEQDVGVQKAVDLPADVDEPRVEVHMCLSPDNPNQVIARAVSPLRDKNLHNTAILRENMRRRQAFCGSE